MRIVEDVTDQRAREEQLRQRAVSDGLTGLAKCRELVEVLDGEITRPKRTGREFSLLFLGLDGRKQIINDRYGNRAGSRALRRLAELLRLCCRSIDTAARYGGDEFALVLPETDAARATLLRAAITSGGLALAQEFRFSDGEAAEKIWPQPWKPDSFIAASPLGAHLRGDRQSQSVHFDTPMQVFLGRFGSRSYGFKLSGIRR